LSTGNDRKLRLESISRKAVESVEMPPCGFKKALHVIVPSYVTMKYLILIGPLWHSTVFVELFLNCVNDLCPI